MPSATPAPPGPHAATAGANPRTAPLAVDHANHRLGYRLNGTLVQRSTDAGQHWVAVLSAGNQARRGRGGCRPARYRSVTALAVNGLLPGTLFVATSGDPGRVPPAQRAYGCDASTGGLFVLRPDGHGGMRRTDSLAAGLPFAQAPGGKAPHAYSLLDLTTDPISPDVVYADVAIPLHGPGGLVMQPAGLYHSFDGGRYWNPAGGGIPVAGKIGPHGAAHSTLAGNPARSTLAIDPAHSAIVFDAIAARLYRSADRGVHWSAVRGVRARKSLRLYINPANPLLVYALSDQGLYHSRNAGLTWKQVTGKGLPPPARIRSLGFNPRSPASFYVTPLHGLSRRFDEPHAPRPPSFDVGLALTPLLYDRVVLALHAAPRTTARLSVVAGARRTGARVTTDDNGFAYATLRLGSHVAPRALRVRVEAGRRSSIVAPWLPPGWVPGQPPPPPATATPTPSDTATATDTPSPSPSPTASFTALPLATTVSIPTPYPFSPLSSVWAWKALTPALPLCPTPPPPITPTLTVTPSVTDPTTATATVTPSLTATVSPTATSTFTPIPALTNTGTPSGTPTPTNTVTPSPTSTPSPTASSTSTPSPTNTVTPSPTATATPVGPCTAPPPTPRQDYAAGWDNADHRLYVFGGTDTHTATFYNDISSYSTITNAWIAVTPATTTLQPAPRYGAGSVWDPTLNELLVFGGMTGAGPYARFTDDLWAYVPATDVWTQLSANGAAGAPAPRAHAALAWDATNNRLLLFGGQTNDSSTPALTNDLWAFTFSATGGGTWTQLSPNSGSQSLPPPRQWAQMAWDNPAGVLRLFGGKNAGSGAMSDTWTWSAAQGWQYDNVPDQPPGRQAAGYYWDETHQRFVVGPGLAMSGNSADVWDYDPTAQDWQQIPVAAPPAPPLRQMVRMVWDAADGQALLFGGRVQGTGAANDLWALVPTGAAGPTATPVVEAHIAKAIDIGETVSGSDNKVELTAAKVQAIAASGAAYVRLSFSIGDGQSTWTSGRLHAYEQVITMLAHSGIGVLALAGSGITGGWPADSWKQNAEETTGGDGINPAIQDYVRQLSLLVNHFYPAPYNVHRWELWNEPNTPLAGCTNFNIACAQQPSLQPSNFAALLALSYQTIKGPLPGAQIISGGIFGHSINGTYSAAASGADYIRHTYDEGINRTKLWSAIKTGLGSYPLDEVGQHLYVDQGQRTTPAVIRTYLDWFHSAYATYEGAGKDTAVTEAGWRTGDPHEPQVTPDMQALNLDTTFEAARRSGYVSDICWFALQDNPAYRNSTSWGLLDRNGHPKPAYIHFQRQ